MDIARHCLDGPVETLTRTDVAQPALFSVSLALNEIAHELGLRPDYVAGHSLGEYSAATAAGALTHAAGIDVVAERGRQMDAAQHERPGAMAAIIGLELAAVERLCTEASSVGSVQLANLNSPTQIVCSGEESAVDRLVELATAAGAQRALRLQVGAAFHSVLMEPVRERMREKLASVSWADARVPIAANYSGALVQHADEVRDALVAQIASPVRWIDCVRTLRDAGITHFLELGPGRVLAGLIRQIDADAEVQPADSREKIQAFAQAHPEFNQAA
jgi:[acyl-carrier-protein] S-malonyltransferase